MLDELFADAARGSSRGGRCRLVTDNGFYVGLLTIRTTKRSMCDTVAASKMRLVGLLAEAVDRHPVGGSKEDGLGEPMRRGFARVRILH